jgi:hypothetical protein
MVLSQQQNKGTVNMKRHCALSTYPLALLGCFGLGACGSDTGAPLAADASTSEAGPSKTPIDSSVDGAGGLTGGIVVVNSNYIDSTSISFLDRDGNLVQDGCFNSGTGATGLTPTLSGDVVLPTQVPLGGPVVIVDRGQNVLTWLDPATCASLRQLAVGTGFASDPHDVVTLSASKAYVTRYAENGAATPAPDDFDDGDDLLIIDPAQSKILGHIDLKPFAPAGVPPCADRALLAEGAVFVSLNAISLDFKTYGTGRIVRVDPTTDQVTGTIDLPGAKNCGAMTYLAAERKLMVACSGAYSDAQQADSSAVVTIDLSVSPPAVLSQVAAAAVGGLPFSNTTLSALDGKTALAVTLGNYGNLPPDRLWSLPLNGTLPSKVFESTEAYALGAVLADAEASHVLLTDGTTNTPAFLRVFDLAAGAFTAGKTVKTNPTQKLPPRALARY